VPVRCAQVWGEKRGQGSAACNGCAGVGWGGGGWGWGGDDRVVVGGGVVQFNQPQHVATAGVGTQCKEEINKILQPEHVVQ